MCVLEARAAERHRLGRTPLRQGSRASTCHREGRGFRAARWPPPPRCWGHPTPQSLCNFIPLGCFTRMTFQTSLLPLHVFILKEGPQRLQVPATRQVGVSRQNHAEARRGYPSFPKLLHREAATGTGDRQLLSHGSWRIPCEINNQVPLMTQYTAVQSKLPRQAALGICERRTCPPPPCLELALGTVVAIRLLLN